MADPVLHIKDAYYFEVPRPFARKDYKSKSDVPEFLQDEWPAAAGDTDAHALEQFNHDLSGKILIPQPFGKLSNLYEKESGFCISKFMILEVVIAVLLIVVFKLMAKKIATGEPVKGRFANFVEVFLLYIRDHIARPAIGHDADKFVPILWTIFFFILTCNLFGMIPWLGAPTGAFSVTLSLAFVTFGTVFIGGTKQFGVVGFWTNQVPSMELPFVLAIIIKPAIFAIEVLGLFIKHGVLGIRLLANMVAGHLVLLGIMGVIVSTASSEFWGIATTISVVGATLFSCLELFVAFLQAYIFTFLSALFIGAAVHSH